MEGRKSKKTSHFFDVLNSPPLVTHFVVGVCLIFNLLSKLLFISVVPQPESSKTLKRFQSLGFLLPLREARYPIVIDDKCSNLASFFGLSNSAVVP